MIIFITIIELSSTKSKCFFLSSQSGKSTTFLKPATHFVRDFFMAFSVAVSGESNFK